MSLATAPPLLPCRPMPATRPLLRCALLGGTLLSGTLMSSACATLDPLVLTPAASGAQGLRVQMPQVVDVTGPAAAEALAAEPDLAATLSDTLRTTLRDAGYAPVDHGQDPWDMALRLEVRVRRYALGALTGRWAQLDGRLSLRSGDEGLGHLDASSHPREVELGTAFHPTLREASERLAIALVNRLTDTEPHRALPTP